MRPFTPRQQVQNSAFLGALARTGNARLAARELGVNRSTYTKRRARSRRFAAQWRAALAASQARLAGTPAAPPPDPKALRTVGGEPHLVHRKDGTLQLRRARTGWMTPAAETRFLQALEGSANVRMSSAAIGFAHTTLYRRRTRSPAFAEATSAALDTACLHLRAALMQAFDRLAGPQYGDTEEGWEERTRDCPLPPMTVDDVLQLLRFHDRRGEG
ncbi:MAG TPA: hypothetical protein VHM92_05135 [Allosphingosinicella sp.]|nr:hypothetical protein [Allosphingosinicella sp.]